MLACSPAILQKLISSGPKSIQIQGDKNNFIEHTTFINNVKQTNDILGFRIADRTS
jgi:hypothetical protein